MAEPQTFSAAPGETPTREASNMVCEGELTERKEPGWGSFSLLAMVVVALWLGSVALVLRRDPSLTSAGSFGDSFGAVNALFSGLAFAGVIFAILLQKRELELQRKELEATRREFKEQTTQFRKQSRSMESSGQITAILELLNRYQSVEMLNAVRSLWSFYREHVDAEEMAEDYIRKMLDAFETIDTAEPEAQVELERHSLHNKRRHVNGFYNTIAALREVNVLPDRLLFPVWQRADLEIIPKILIPIARAHARHDGIDDETLRISLGRLQRLYDDSMRWNAAQSPTGASPTRPE